jgi:hypothetical protein
LSIGAKVMKSKKITRSKSKQRRTFARRRKQLSEDVEPVELNRTIQAFDRGAPDRFISEAELMTDGQRRIYEHSN